MFYSTLVHRRSLSVFIRDVFGVVDLQESQLGLISCCVYFDAATTTSDLGFLPQYGFPHQKNHSRMV